ncbi:GAF and ANTAR domain-containing protein [Cryptosporangium phraense]|uniref:GAF and ANTAR domain-containing protein n=1 Tax=Cryptosporangium phraense TaxID=2593070 RepID=UPI00197AF19B|nr:GAF and ANTAR domain-containing protein [Cryptosporangium phraense]
MEAGNRPLGGEVALPSAATSSFAELSRIVLADLTLEQVLERVATLARAAITGTQDVSVTLIKDDRPSTAASTGGVALDLDERQYASGYGPCLDAARGGEVLVIADMAAETRWPQYRPKALELDVRSGLSVPLPVQDQVIGALNLYGRVPDAFDAQAVELTVAFASYAAVAVANAQLYSSTADLAEGMRQAMASRALIEQAKGILMAEYGCSADEAFDHLSRMSQNANRKLREVAAGIVARTQRSAPSRPAMRSRLSKPPVPPSPRGGSEAEG